MRIPLGAKPPISGMWEKGVAVAAAIFILVLIGLMLQTPLVNLIYLGVLIIVFSFVAAVCLGLYDSAREALKYAKSSHNTKGYNL
jgi:thiol:disulfide interchange protein